MADLATARRKAETWLAEHGGALWCADVELILRALLAATPEPAPEPVSNAYTLPDAVREAAESAALDLLSYDEAVTGNEKRHALSRCKNALRDVLRTIDAARGGRP